MVEIDLLRMLRCFFIFHDFCEGLQLIEQRAERMEAGLECFHQKPWMGSWEHLVMGNA
jgi:hypothetical protein